MQNKPQKPKFKHNKKRNTAFLFESLIKELTKNVVYGKKDKQVIISKILKEHFNKNNILSKELGLYKQLYETTEFPKDIADKLITKIKDEHEKLNESAIYNEQSKLIAKINKYVGSHIYDNFVPNYKTLATISQIFNKQIETKQKVLLEQELIGNITGKLLKEEKEVKTVDNSVIKRFVDRFNETYNELLNEQKSLLTRYINSQDDVELKIYLHEEFNRLLAEMELITKNDSSGNASKIYESLKQSKIDTITDDLIKRFMYVQQFIHEVKN